MTDLDAKAFIKRGKSLVPADEFAEEFIDGLKDGKEVLLTIRKPRSPQHHRWTFKLLSRVVENSERWRSLDELLDALKLATGYAEMQVDLHGDVYMRPKSVSFAAMDELEFRAWKEKALAALAPILGYDPLMLMEEK